MFIKFLTAASLMMTSLANADEALLKKVVDEQVKTDDQAATSQAKVSKLADETQAMLEQYRTRLKEIDNLRAYNDQLEKLTTNQVDEMAAIRKQISEIEVTHRSIVPLMSDMLGTLEAFIKLDLPFLKDERATRLAQLKDLMNRADVSTSEKYRRLLEAYQIENEYARSIESYRNTIDFDGKQLTVDCLRVGRLALYFQTLDGKISGQWDHQKNVWTTVDNSFKKPLREGIQIAKKQLAPNLMTLPLALAEAKL